MKEKSSAESVAPKTIETVETIKDEKKVVEKIKEKPKPRKNKTTDLIVFRGNTAATGFYEFVRRKEIVLNIQVILKELQGRSLKGINFKKLEF